MAVNCQRKTRRQKGAGSRRILFVRDPHPGAVVVNYRFLDPDRQVALEVVSVDVQIKVKPNSFTCATHVVDYVLPKLRPDPLPPKTLLQFAIPARRSGDSGTSGLVCLFVVGFPGTVVVEGKKVLTLLFDPDGPFNSSLYSCG